MEKSKNHIWIVFIILWIPLLAFELLSTNKHNYKWVFVYYMSYDNNLGRYGTQIINELSKGISNDEIAVITQIDFSDNKGMKRIIQTYSDGEINVNEKFLRREDSADTKELEEFLDWISDKWKAENYCVVFTNHGGMLNSMCLDERPFSKVKANKKFPSGKWFQADHVAKILADFNQNVDGKVRLLFLQQCGKAQIQSLYSFTDTCEYLMASPVAVGAPNTYYTKTLQAITGNPEITGRALAETIMKEDEHYNIYTLINTDKMKELPQKITPVLNAFTQAESLEAPKDIRFMFEHTDEKFYDFQTYLKSLSLANNNIAQNQLQTFFGWCDTSLVENVSFKNYSPEYEGYIPIDQSWRCGLSLYVPSTKEELGRYDYLPIYKQTNLEEFMRLIVNSK
ncbi:MAG: hypothetical protein JXA96_04470 [Sedimentisphaerales bacterium]|nr:hypothetical protein [Sedimentisphaerales bacterium]